MTIKNETIDPSNLTPESSIYLYALLQSKGSLGLLEEGVAYDVMIDGVEHCLKLTHPILRRKRKSNDEEYRYEVFDKGIILGKGGYGTVYKVIGTIVAESNKIKMKDKHRLVKYQKYSTKSPKSCESKISSKIKYLHAKTETLVTIDKEFIASYLVMEELEGMSLTQLIREDRKGKRVLSTEERLILSRNLEKALAEIHQKNIVHGDIKPSNIWVNPETLEVKIIDFGLAKKFGLYSNVTRGTAMYGAPEMFESRILVGNVVKMINQTSDQYSMAMTISLLWGGNVRRRKCKDESDNEYHQACFELSKTQDFLSLCQLESSDLKDFQKEGIRTFLQQSVCYKQLLRPNARKGEAYFDELAFEYQSKSLDENIQPQAKWAYICAAMAKNELNSINLKEVNSINELKLHLKSGISIINDKMNKVSKINKTKEMVKIFSDNMSINMIKDIDDEEKIINKLKDFSNDFLKKIKFIMEFMKKMEACKFILSNLNNSFMSCIFSKLEKLTIKMYDLVGDISDDIGFDAIEIIDGKLSNCLEKLNRQLKKFPLLDYIEFYHELDTEINKDPENELIKLKKSYLKDLENKNLAKNSQIDFSNEIKKLKIANTKDEVAGCLDKKSFCSTYVS